MPAQATHPALADSTDLRAFLEDNEGEWQVEVRPSPPEAGVSNTPASGSSGWPQCPGAACPGSPHLPPAQLLVCWW